MLPDLMQNSSIGGKDSKQFTAKELVTVLTENVTICGLFTETIKVVSVLLVVPTSAENSERSFSMLRIFKTWLRSRAYNDSDKVYTSGHTALSPRLLATH